MTQVVSGLFILFGFLTILLCQNNLKVTLIGISLVFMGYVISEKLEGNDFDH